MFLFDSINVWSLVYFIQTESGQIKIGSTANLKRRLRELQTANHEKLTVLHYTSGGNALEYFLHKKFEKHNIRRDWFQPANELLDLIVELKYEDKNYGRIESIIEHALNIGFKLDKEEKELLVDMTRGACLQIDNVETKLFYWTILDSYKNYLKRFPVDLRHKRRLGFWVNEGKQSWDADISKRVCK